MDSGMFGTYMLFPMVIMGLVFASLTTTRHGRDHELAALIAAIVGVIVITTPVQKIVLKTYGTLAATTATWINGVSLGIAWILGLAIAYGLLKWWKP